MNKEMEQRDFRLAQECLKLIKSLSDVDSRILEIVALALRQENAWGMRNAANLLIQRGEMADALDKCARGAIDADDEDD